MKRFERRTLPLLPEAVPAGSATPPDEFRDRLGSFARAVAHRHRRSHAGVGEFLAALRGYHRTLSICSETRVPPLDDSLTALATSVYLAVRRRGQRSAA